MKQTLLLFAFALISNMLLSQAQPKAFEDWKTTSGTQDFYFKNISKTDPSGNVIVAGTTMNSGTTDILVAKYNSSGVQLWIQQIAGTATNGVDFAAGLLVDNTYIYITGAVTNNTATPETDCVTMKLASSTGSVVWSSTYNGAGNFHDMGKHVAVDGSGNVFISGATYNGSMNTDFLCLKYNSSGSLQWSKTWDYIGNDDASIKVATSGSNLNVTGAVTTATAGVYKLATLSLSQSTGSLLATNVSTAVTTTSVDVVTDFTSDASANIILVGSTTVGGQGNNFYVQKMSNTLVPAWTYTWNGAASSNDVAKAVELDGSGNIYIAGYSTNATLGRELTLIKLNSSGVNQWTQTSGFAGDDEANDMIIDASNDIYLSGYKTNNDQDYYTAKYNASGTKLWEIDMDGNKGLNDYATNMTLDSLNNVIVTGQSGTSYSTYDFLTVKYVQHDVITPTDFNMEVPNANHFYYTNRGQLLNTNDSIVPDIKFYTHNTWPSFLLKDHNQSFVFSKVDTVIATNDTLQRVDLIFDHCIESAKTYPMDPQPDGQLNFFLAHTGSEGITGIKGNQRLITSSLYPNIDLMCSSNESGIKYYFIVKPGGNIRDIEMTFTGATSYSLDGTSNALSINSDIGSLTFERPIAYQLTTGNTTVAVTGWTPDWQTNGATNKYKFNDGAYTASLSLVILVEQSVDPAKVLHLGGPEWSTPFGGLGYDEAFDIKTDTDGNSYWVGTTNGGDIPFYPQSPGIFSGPFLDFDIFIAKFGTAYAASANAQGFITEGDKLKWTTYYGGNGEDWGRAIAIEGNTAAGDIYITGSTNSTDFQIFTKSGYYNDTYSGNLDAFVVNLKYLAGGLKPTSDIWATYLGGAGDDIGKDVKVNGNQIFIGGSTTSNPSSNTCAVPNTDTDFPVCNANFSSTQSGAIDGFIVNLNTSTGLTKATYIGGSSDDVVNELSVASATEVYFVGTTNSTHTTFSPVANTGSTPYNQSTIGGGNDAFFGRISALGDWLSYYGGSGDDKGNTITITNNNKFIIGGLTESSTPVCSACTCAVPATVGHFPVCPKSGSTTYSSFNGGNSDGFLAEFDIDGTYTWGTYMGGDADDEISSVSFGVNNATDYLFFAGETNTMTKNSLFYDIGNAGVYQYNLATSPVPTSTSSDGFFGVYYNDNVLLHSDYILGDYIGTYISFMTDMKTNMNKVHISGAHYYYAGKTTYPDYLRRAGNGSDVNGAMGAYSNAQTWPFNGNNTPNVGSGNTVNYNPDAAMVRVNLHGMPMVGIKELQAIKKNNSLLIFPNPATDMLSIFSKFDHSENITIEIINLLGQTVYSESLSNKSELKTVIPIGHLSNGVYNVTVKGSEFQANKLFIKQ